MKSSSKWTKSYKQKAFSWFCISEKSKFSGKYQEQPYVQPAIFSGGRFLFVPKASTPALIDEVNVLPLLIQMGLHIGHKPVIKIYDKNEQVQIPFLSEEHYQTLELHRKEISNTRLICRLPPLSMYHRITISFLGIGCLLYPFIKVLLSGYY